MRVFVACERSGAVRRAFRDKGHEAWSCDIEEADDKSPFHFRGDVFEVLDQTAPWDVLIAFPPCTYLTRAGARWWPNRQQEQKDALEFVRKLLEYPIPKSALENPPGKIGSAIRPADQYVHPWQFGHMETKTTGLWLKNLPKLQPTHDVKDDMHKLPAHQKHRIYSMPDSKGRAERRSKTYEGMARAMAEQWGCE